jgi:hypothetical protein
MAHWYLNNFAGAVSPDGTLVLKQLCRCHSKLRIIVAYMFFSLSTVSFKALNWEKISASWCVTHFTENNKVNPFRTVQPKITHLPKFTQI